jgi:hypothetical protein
VHDEEFYIKIWQDAHSTLPAKTEMILDISDKPYVEKFKLFSGRRIIWVSYSDHMSATIHDYDLNCMPKIRSVSEAAIQIALYLNFKNIFILGVEHSNYRSYRHFSKNPYYKNDSWNDVFVKQQHDTEKEFISYGYIFSKYKLLYQQKKNIYNANANFATQVDTFPQVIYEKLFDPESYIKELERAKDCFIEYPPRMINQEQVTVKKEVIDRFFIHNLKLLCLRVMDLDASKNYLIYGAGTLGQMLTGILPGNIIGYLDRSEKLIGNNVGEHQVFGLEQIDDLDYDFLIISPFGREEQIILQLVEEYAVDKSKIIKIYQGLEQYS